MLDSSSVPVICEHVSYSPDPAGAQRTETALRYFIVAALGRGDSSASVKRMFELARSTVVDVAKRFRTGGLAALRDRREGGGEGIVVKSTLGDLMKAGDVYMANHGSIPASALLWSCVARGEIGRASCRERVCSTV